MSDSTEQYQYVIFEFYHNAQEYTSIEGKVPIVRAICPSLQEAAELIGQRNITEIRALLDAHEDKGTMGTFQEYLYVVKAPVNTFVDILNLPRIPLEHDVLTEPTRNMLKAVKEQYNQLSEKILKGTPRANAHLQVNQDIYEKDRRAREYEMMQRMHIKPLWRGNVTNAALPVKKRSQVIPTTDGRIPQPAVPVSVQQQHQQHVQVPAANSLRLAPGNIRENPATFQSTPTPTASAPIPVPGLVPVANEVPNPITTSVPLAPVVPGAAIRSVVTDSTGHTHASPPLNTGTNETSRVTGV